MPRPVLDSIPDLFASLGRDPEELIGQPETSWLDFKEQSYRLDKTNPDRDRACFELAKDASALANARGGVIVVGVGTRLEPMLREEVATRLRPVPEGAVNPKQIQDVLWEWIHPKLNVQTQAHQIGNGGEIWSIFIEHQQERDFPFIISKEFVVEGKGATRNLFGIYTRVGSQNSPYPPAQVQHWIHEGWRASLEPPVSTPLSAPDDADAILTQSLNAIGFEAGTCLYYVQASPSPPSMVGRFYRGAPDSLYDLLSNIPQLRSSGFSLPDGFPPERAPGGGIRMVWPRNDAVSITPNGLTTAIEGQEHLTWASSKVAPEGEVWINPLALVEFTLEFWRFYVGQVQARIDGQVKTIWRAGMRALGGPLLAYLPSSFVRRATKERPDADDFDLNWQTTDERDPGRLAFDVLSRIYARFGFAEEIIPWAENRRVSEEQILSIRRGG